MASLVSNEKGFKVVKLSQEEAQNLGWGSDEGMICMACNGIIKEELYFVVVLNDVMSKSCYERWYKEAKYYPEDKSYEDRALKDLFPEIEKKQLYKKF